MKKLKPTDLKGFVVEGHQPYTDYNQEIIDWLKDCRALSDFADTVKRYIFTQEENFYPHNKIFADDVYYTNEQFMEWIGMTKTPSEKVTHNDVFTKSDLKDGMICTTRDGNVYTVKGDRLLRDGGMYMLLEDINDTLICEDIGEFDIIRVEQPTVVFERVDIKQRSIKKELELAEAKKQRLENHINILKSKLK